MSHLITLFLYTLQCLCIAPTYELALQIGQVIEKMGKFYPDVKLAYGIRGNRRKYYHFGINILTTFKPYSVFKKCSNNSPL